MTSNRSNGFVNLNGVPYLVGTYIDNCRFQHVDSGMLNDGITVDTTDPMRAIVDIRVNDINHREGINAGGYSNMELVNDLIESVRQAAMHGKMELPTMTNALIARVSYRLESATTGLVIRSMVEDIRIDDRVQFIDLGVSRLNSSVILSNFCNTAISSINKFTTGQNVMQLRITDIKFYYEQLVPNEVSPASRDMCPAAYDSAYSAPFGSLQEYHEAVQSHHYMGDPMCDVVPPYNWRFFNYFYHFANGGHIIDLHMHQIKDPAVNKILIPCGDVAVNKVFIINPGHRIIFKFSIWKNDLAIMSDTAPIARILRAPVYDSPRPPHHHHDHCHDHCYNDAYIDYQQNAAIHDLNTNVASLTKKVDDLAESIKPGNPGTNPDDPTNPINEIYKMIQDLSDRIDALNKPVPLENNDHTVG